MTGRSPSSWPGQIDTPLSEATSSESLPEPADTHGQQGSQDSQTRERAWLPTHAKLLLHSLSFCCNVASLLVYALFDQRLFFIPLLVVWVLAGVLCAWAALKELQPRSRDQCLQRWLWAVVGLGFLRGLQIKHICRRPSQRPSAFNSKTFDGIFEGFFFALANQYAFFLLDDGAPSCPWYLAPTFSEKCGQCTHIRFLFLASALFSMLSLAVAVVEVDYRVSFGVRRKIDDCMSGGLLHFMYRASETVLRLSLINLFCLFLRPELGDEPVTFGSLLLYMPVLGIGLCYTLILHIMTKMNGAASEFLVAHVAVALALVSVNAVQFVDRDVYVREARRTSQTIFRFRLVELAAVVLYIIWQWRRPFPAICNCHPNRSIGSYAMHSNQALASVELTAAIAVYTVLSLSLKYVRRSMFGGNYNEEVLGFRLRDVSSLGASVERTVPHGLSSFLVQASTGVTHWLFANPEEQITDFAIEKVLGEGGFGVVTLVKSKRTNGRLLEDRQQRLSALKLVVVINEMQEVCAQREREYLVKLTGLRHPFIMRLERFFDIDRSMEFKDATGNWVQDKCRRRSFDKGLMMEYCPLGDYEAWLRNSNKALVAPSKSERPSTEELKASIQWLVRARRLCAEMVAAVNFLHKHDFAHRDLKPSNILLKTGPDEQMHVCIADFGLAKQGGTLDTYGGSADYMAPEVQSRSSGYTKAVDLWSLGKVILVSLWGTKIRLNSLEQPWELQVPQRAWYLWHPRMPTAAGMLVETMMQTEPDARGSAADLLQHGFFQDVYHRNVHLRKVDWMALKKFTWVRDDDAVKLTASGNFQRSQSATG